MMKGWDQDRADNMAVWVLLSFVGIVATTVATWVSNLTLSKLGIPKLPYWLTTLAGQMAISAVLADTMQKNHRRRN